MHFDTLKPPDAQPICSFANGEMGLMSNYIIRILEKLTGQPRIRKLYFEYVNDDLPPKNCWSDALERLESKLNITRDVKDGVAETIPKTGRVLAISNHPCGVIDG